MKIFDRDDVINLGLFWMSHFAAYFITLMIMYFYAAEWIVLSLVELKIALVQALLIIGHHP